MRVMFPKGSGGPYLVPGVGPVSEGEPFDWPGELPPVAGTVVAEPEPEEADGEKPPEDEAAPGRKAASGKGTTR